MIMEAAGEEASMVWYAGIVSGSRSAAEVWVLVVFSLALRCAVQHLLEAAALANIPFNLIVAGMCRGRALYLLRPQATTTGLTHWRARPLTLVLSLSCIEHH